ncbi:hypothetical protein [Streptomyces sp. NPDC020917]
MGTKKGRSTAGLTIYVGRVPAEGVQPNPIGNRAERRAAAKEQKKNGN